MAENENNYECCEKQDMKNKRFFNSTAENLSESKNNKMKDDKCPDQIVGDITVTKSKTMYEPHSERENIGEKTVFASPKVIMILESPHTKEFIGKIGPAKGKTKEHMEIKNIFNEACPLHDKDKLYGMGPYLGKYPLILMNAIQYQCSLGLPPQNYRDCMFLSCWNKFGKDDLTERLRRYHRTGDIIINACTLGTNKNKTDEAALKNLVRNAIFQDYKTNCFIVNHPCINWNTGNYGWGKFE